MPPCSAHKLVEAFEATLQEAADADLLLHVIDAASPVLDEQMAEVQRVLRDISADGVPQILVYNKLDNLPESQRPRAASDVLEQEGGVRVPRVFVSAIDGTGLPELRRLISQAVATSRTTGLNSAETASPSASLEDTNSSPLSRPLSQLAEDNFEIPMTMSDTNPRPARQPSRTRDMVVAARALIAGLAGAVRRRLGRHPTLVLNNGGRGEGPPDLDELWRDFNRKLGNLFGGKRSGGSGSGGGPNFQPDMKGTGIGISLVAGLVVLIWGCQWILHRAGRAAGGRHVLRQIQPYRGRRLQLALPVPVPGERGGGRHPASLGGGGPQRGGAGHWLA